MCNPVAAAVMSIGGSLYSGITGMQAAREQANAARMQSEYQAQALEFNAAQARNEAEAVSRQGANEVSDLQKRQRAVAASGRAAAGASGLMAAISAARAGASVVVLEHMDSAGRKLLLTGSGKCNFTNMLLSRRREGASVRSRIYTTSGMELNMLFPPSTVRTQPRRPRTVSTQRHYSL